MSVAYPQLPGFKSKVGLQKEFGLVVHGLPKSFLSVASKANRVSNFAIPAPARSIHRPEP